MSDNWGEFQSELSRKTLDTLYVAAHRYSEGEISQGDLRLILDTLWDMGAGLVERDVMDLITRTRRQFCPSKRTSGKTLGSTTPS